MKNFELPIKVEAIVYFIDDNGVKFFLAIKRSEEDGGFWQPVTGTLESTDNIEGCLIREINEEIGLVREDIISISDCIYHFVWNKKSIGEINEYVFAVEVKRLSQIKLSTEHVEFKWGTKDEIKDTYEMSDNKIAIDKI
jgi:8-oxo-dGTP pyrophosphatase MutT (NUDIX family)